MSIYAPSTENFQTLLRISRSSIADPPWFAAPVEAQEDDDSVTIVFHAPMKSHGPVGVEAREESVCVRGRSGAMRLCALPYQLDRSRIETSRSGELLRVRMRKKRPTTDATSASSPAQST